jgi:hypothetical protein
LLSLVGAGPSRQTQGGLLEAPLTFIVSPSDPLSYVLGTVSIFMSLVLAWRAYRFSTREEQQRKMTRQRRLDR